MHIAYQGDIQNFFEFLLKNIENFLQSQGFLAALLPVYEPSFQHRNLLKVIAVQREKNKEKKPYFP